MAPRCRLPPRYRSSQKLATRDARAQTSALERRKGVVVFRAARTLQSSHLHCENHYFAEASPNALKDLAPVVHGRTQVKGGPDDAGRVTRRRRSTWAVRRRSQNASRRSSIAIESNESCSSGLLRSFRRRLNAWNCVFNRASQARVGWLRVSKLRVSRKVISEAGVTWGVRIESSESFLEWRPGDEMESGGGRREFISRLRTCRARLASLRLCLSPFLRIKRRIRRHDRGTPDCGVR